jgi:hypothetical protein
MFLDDYRICPHIPHVKVSKTKSPVTGGNTREKKETYK